MKSKVMSNYELGNVHVDFIDEGISLEVPFKGVRKLKQI